MSANSRPREESFGTPAESDGKAAAPMSSVKLPPPAYDDPGVKQANRKAIFIGATIGILALVVLVLVVYLLLQNPALTANIRDVVIILTAVVLIIMSLVISVLLVILLYRLQEIMHFLRAELVPILTETQKAAKAVYGTTMFMSDNVAKPAIKAAGFVSRVQRMAQAVNMKAKSSAGQR
ncbi:MAG: hypothetical protein RMN52_11050 [Anaerolineae bacterium]|nr:hypothetical protein [Candidatus Roseilinea sp.]MDW8450530.1 hypothetical protein [Anaerolineae bacterium]